MNNNKIKIELLTGNCIGIATCTALMGQVFSLGKDGRVQLNKGDHLADYDGATLDKLLEAAESCPTLAIKITDEETGKVLFPK